MRVLVSANPMFGHVNPMLPVALAAVRAGHTVVVATGADMADHVRGHGLDSAPVGPTYAEARTDPDEPWLAFFARVGRRRAEQLVPMARAWRPDVVVHDETELAGAVAAAATGARHVVHGLGIPPSVALWQALLPDIRTLGRCHGIAALDDDLPEATYLDLCPPALRPDGPSFWPHVQPLRPVTVAPAENGVLPADVSGLGGPVVHVTLGTVFHGRTDLLRTAVEGVASVGVGVVVTTGPGSDPGVLGPQPRPRPRARAVVVHPYVPHRLLLPRCAAVVSHGGAGILFAALAHGLPQLVLPQGADQFGNADACVAVGAALSLTHDISAAAVADAVRRLLDEPGFGAAARRVGTELTTLPGADEVVAAITSGR